MHSVLLTSFDGGVFHLPEKAETSFGKDTHYLFNRTTVNKVYVFFIIFSVFYRSVPGNKFYN